MQRNPCYCIVFLIVVSLLTSCAPTAIKPGPAPSPPSPKASPPPATAPAPSPPPVPITKPAPSPPTQPSPPPDTTVIPQFPWPPPEASARSEVPKKFLVRPGTKEALLRDIDSRLSLALRDAGYAGKSYCAVPEGFALVTRLEQIESDGRPKPDSERWAVGMGPLREFSLSAYLKSLSSARAGYFRLIVFVVTPYPVSYSKAKIIREEAQLWLQEGLNRLPPSIGAWRFTADHSCTALIYEFEKSEVERTPHTVIPGRLTGRTHLEQSGLWASLGR